LASFVTTPLLSNFERPSKTRRSTRDSPLLLFDALHEDGMAVKKLSTHLKNCSLLFLLSSPAFPVAVTFSFFTLSWFLVGFALMISQVLLGSTGFRVAKKRKIKKVEHFLRWLRVYVIVLLLAASAYQVHAFLGILRRQCRGAQLPEACSDRAGLEAVPLLLVCVLPCADCFLLVFLCYVLKIATRFQRALINDLVGINAAWQQ
jgi:hypothetical protein